MLQFYNYFEKILYTKLSSDISKSDVLHVKKHVDKFPVDGWPS